MPVHPVAAEEKIQDRAQERHEDDDDDPDDLVGVAALRAVDDRPNPQHEPENREDIAQA